MAYQYENVTYMSCYILHIVEYKQFLHHLEQWFSTRDDGDTFSAWSLLRLSQLKRWKDRGATSILQCPGQPHSEEVSGSQ